VSGPNLRKHEGFRSRFLRNQRDLIVYLPPGYDDQPGRRFPVLYLHDGQNLFDGATSFIPGMDWHVGQTADQSICSGAVEPLIIVGMYNTKARIREYTPTHVPKLGGGRADRYAKFLIEEVKPFIEREYRTLAGPEKTGIGGSSLGGLVSLYLGLRIPEAFGKIAALSPSVWWNQGVTSAHAKAPASSRMLNTFATSCCKRAGNSTATCTISASKAPSTTKRLGRSASVHFFDFCIQSPRPKYNPPLSRACI
jgi:predicted alpha/beta superfamily hydrolase